MQNEKLQILLDQKLIRINDFVSTQMDFMFDNESYLISEKVDSILTETFMLYLNIAGDMEVKSIEDAIILNEKFTPKNLESRINIRNKILQNKFNELTGKSGVLQPYSLADMKENAWKRMLNKDCLIDLIHGIVIEAGCDQQRIAFYFYEYFSNDDIEKFFEKYAIVKGIEHLKNSIGKIDENKAEQDLEITYTAIATICILKGVIISYKDDAIKQINQYNSELKNYKNLILEYKRLNVKDGFIKDCDNPVIRKYRLKNLENAKPYLIEDELFSAENYIEQINKMYPPII